MVEQCLNLYKTNIVQTKRHETSLDPHSVEGIYPRIHGMVFNPKDGIMKSLTTDLEIRANHFDSIYGMLQK